jgi:hypothetical protein
VRIFMRYLRGQTTRPGVHCRKSYGNDHHNERKRVVVDGGIANRESGHCRARFGITL